MPTELSDWMSQAVIRTPTTFDVVTVPRPNLQSDDEILLRTAACGICSGDLMEWYLAKKVGTVLGHEVVGYAAEVGSRVAHIEPGQLVFVHHHAPCMRCLSCQRDQFVHCKVWKESRIDPGGMAEYIRVPGEIASTDCFPIDDLTPAVGIFIEPLACSVKCLLMAQPQDAELGIIVGCGVMGLLNVAVAKAMGTKNVWAIEPDPWRREMAKRFGADDVFAPGHLPKDLCADYVVVGPGHPDVIKSSLKYVRPGGALLLFTPTPAGVRTDLDLGDIYFKEIRILPSYSCGPTDTRLAYDLLSKGKVDPRFAITYRFPLSDVQAAYNVAKAGGSALKVLVEFPRQ